MDEESEVQHFHDKPISGDTIKGATTSNVSDVEGNCTQDEVDEIEIDDQLEKKLKNHGLNRRNVKTIIHELLNNENVLNLLKENLGDKNKSDSIPEPKQLRSQRKKSPVAENVPKFTELDLPEDDEEDEEYDPNKEPDLDEVISHASIQCTDLDTSIEVTEKQESSDQNVRPTMATNSFISDLSKIDNEIRAIDENAARSVLTEDEIIAQRTRSKHSLLDIAISEIETSFQPPDVTEDMYNPSGDTDWHKWLAELMMDNTQTETRTEEDDDDPEFDPDYNFLESESEDVVEKDETKNNRGTRVSKKELQELLDLLNVPDEILTYQGEPPCGSATNETSAQIAAAKQVSQPSADNVHSKSITKPSTSATVKSKLNYLREELKIDTTYTKPTAPDTFILSEDQLKILDLQMRQHVQLLCQTNLLCRNTKRHSTIVHDTHALLKEVKQLADYNKQIMSIPRSTFEVPLIEEALFIAKMNIKPSVPVTRLTKFERNRGFEPVPRNIATIIATSGVFQFASLLPLVAAAKGTQDHARVFFTKPEDNLLVLGLAQMETHLVPWHILVHQYLIPCKLAEQIRYRATNANQGHYGPENPIRLFRKFGRIPSVPHLAKPNVGPGTKFENMLSLRGVKVPDWLLVLHQEEENPGRIQCPSSLMEQEKVGADEAAGGESQVTTVAMTTTPVPAPQPSNATPVNLTPGEIVLPTFVLATKPTEISKSASQYVPIRSLPSGAHSCSKKLIESIKRTFSPKKKILKKERKKPFHKKLLRDKVIQGKPLSASPSAALNEPQPLGDNPEQVSSGIGRTEEDMSFNNDSGIQQEKENQVLEEKNVEDDEQMEINKQGDDLNLLDDFHDADDEEMTEEDDCDELVDMEEDLSSQLKPSKDLPTDEDSDEEGKSPKRTESKKKTCLSWKRKMGKDEEHWKQVRSSWKSKKLGGRLHRVHPGLAGKKIGGRTRMREEEDQLSRNLRKSAEDVRLLEEDTIVQLDPSRVEKEMLFAQGYMKKMEDTLKDHPDVLMDVLNIFCQFDADPSQAPPSLFLKLQKVLQDWPELLRGFAPFLLPEQAYCCGLLEEQQVYARARKFLRQLEIRFHDNPQHLNKILGAFHAVAEGAIFTEQEMKNNILSLLKSDLYLQEEFLMFFDDERPPESRLHGDYEEITLPDDSVKDTPTSCEYIYIPSAEGIGQATTIDEGIETAKSPSGNRLRHKEIHALDYDEDKEEMKAGRLDVATEEEIDDGQKSDEFSDDDPLSSKSSCLPPEIGVISEDALSCSPFKRHNSTQESNTQERPLTPSNTVRDEHLPVPQPVQDISHKSQSSSLGAKLPVTPTGSPEKDDRHKETNLVWTRESDALLLRVCKEIGPGTGAFGKVAEMLGRPTDKVASRFTHLMSLLTGVGEDDDDDDTDTTSHNSDTDDDKSE